jgi:hypothetical protein
LVAKVDRYDRYLPRLDAELANLTSLAHVEAVTGLVPAPVGIVPVPGGSALVQAGLAGRPLHVLLRDRGRYRSRPAARDHDRVLDWFDRLRSWSSGTAPTTSGLTLDDLTDRMGALLPPELVAGGCVTTVGQRTAGLPTLTLAEQRVHGDLGPSNLLVRSRRGPLALVDWEGDTGPHTPLAEALVFINHYVRATPLDTGPMPSQESAAERAFLADDGLGRLSRRSWTRLVATMGVPDGLADVTALATLVTLAEGNAPTAHGQRSRAMWHRLLTHLVERATHDPAAWSTAWPDRP